jgi:cation:H+ antiporter
VSLVVLSKSADFFTDASEQIGIYFGIPPFIVGVTIVAIGTSLPELISSLVAVYSDAGEIVVGNVVGSNIANIFLILGVAALISGLLNIEYDLVSVDLPLFVGSAFLLGLTVWDGKYTVGEAILSLAGYVVYTFYAVNVRKDDPEEDASEEEEATTKSFPVKEFAILALSSLFIFVGAKYTIDSAVKISEILNIGKEIIAVSAVALGTSLPELIVTINQAKKGNPEVAIGNVLGSNIFNAFVVMGLPGLTGRLVIPENILESGLLVMLAGTVLFFFVTQDEQVTKWEGFLFFLFYAWFIGNLFGIL